MNIQDFRIKVISEVCTLVEGGIHKIEKNSYCFLPNAKKTWIKTSAFYEEITRSS